MISKRLVSPVRCAATFAALLLSPALAQAATPAPFGHACTLANGVRFCPTTDAGPGRTVNGVTSFDGVPLDVDVTLPATGNGPWPTIVMLHGYGSDKTSFETVSPTGTGTNNYHYNNVFYAQRGYAVVNSTARGFGHSCGGGLTADHTGACAHGYIRLDDSRYEARDVQYLLGLLADEGVTSPHAIGVTGISYGGGASLELGYLKNRIRLQNGQFEPWKSPKGTPLAITAAYPRWEWSDLVDALLPNGRFLDFQPSTNGLSRSPVGVPIQSYINGLYVLGQTTGYYCGNPPATPCTDASSNLPLQFTQVLKGEPADATTTATLNDMFANHSAFSLELPSGGPAPLLLENGWTDDLFPPSEALRAYNQLRGADAKAPVTLQFGDLGHARGSNKATVNDAFQNQAATFFDAWLRKVGKAPAAGSVEAFTQTCPATTPDGGPFRASSWAALHPLALSFGSGAAQTVTATGDAQDGPPFDPVPQLDPQGTTDACRTIAPGGGPGTAVYTLASHGFTMLGLPTVTATIHTTGNFGELDSRLYDVMPNGTQRLISRGTYRLLDNQSGKITFQLHGNGYDFAPGHTVKLELRGNDALYYRPSNDTTFTVQVSNLTVSLPLPASALSATVTPAQRTAGRQGAFRFRATAMINGQRTPVAGVLVKLLGHSARTGPGGVARMTLALPHAGRFRATLSKDGLRTVSATVRATAAPAPRRPATRPSFTG
ncbi:MAG TPA: CocE/NonD family hydrolase [Solirubrobacteraceae bacterium]|nr:CocE/NonD family hydrolase [Solirubrobacteraceae bacterium]